MKAAVPAGPWHRAQSAGAPGREGVKGDGQGQQTKITPKSEPQLRAQRKQTSGQG